MSGSARRTALGAATLGSAVLGLALALPAVAQAAPTALLVGTAGPGCTAPGYPTVVAAVAAAAPGATITVCPGVYTGTVTVAKPLTFRGAQSGVDARTGRTNLAAESVIDGGGSAGFRITGATSNVMIDGFTVRNSGGTGDNSGNSSDGIEAFSGGSGFTFVNDIVTQTTYGINMSSSGAVPSTVGRNRFVDNNRAGNQGGSGVFICCGPGNNLSISDNLFSGHTSAGVNTAGDPSRLSTGLRIERNKSVDDATFAVVVNATGAVLANNVVTSTLVGDAAGSALFVGGGTTGLQITRNVVSGGAATGIRVTNFYGPPNVGLVASANTITGRLNGVRLTGQTSGSVTGNVINRSSGVGILLEADNSGVSVTRNVVNTSGVLDCRDLSTGTRTAGTADTWSGNVGRTSSPAGICGR